MSGFLDDSQRTADSRCFPLFCRVYRVEPVEGCVTQESRLDSTDIPRINGSSADRPSASAGKSSKNPDISFANGDTHRGTFLSERALYAKEKVYRIIVSSTRRPPGGRPRSCRVFFFFVTSWTRSPPLSHHPLRTAASTKFRFVVVQLGDYDDHPTTTAPSHCANRNAIFRIFGRPKKKIAAGVDPADQHRSPTTQNSVN